MHFLNWRLSALLGMACSPGLIWTLSAKGRAYARDPTFLASRHGAFGPPSSRLVSACATIVAVAFVVLAPSTGAKESVTSSGLTVPYGDVDVVDARDAAVLLQGFEDTADRICWDLRRPSALKKNRVGQCRRVTVEPAVRKAEIEPLTRVWTSVPLYRGPQN